MAFFSFRLPIPSTTTAPCKGVMSSTSSWRCLIVVLLIVPTKRNYFLVHTSSDVLIINALNNKFVCSLSILFFTIIVTYKPILFSYAIPSLSATCCFWNRWHVLSSQSTICTKFITSARTGSLTFWNNHVISPFLHFYILSISHQVYCQQLCIVLFNKMPLLFDFKNKVQIYQHVTKGGFQMEKLHNSNPIQKNNVQDSKFQNTEKSKRKLRIKFYKSIWDNAATNRT